jgi:hypothetical protein
MQSPCKCSLDNSWRIIAEGALPPTHPVWGAMFSPNEDGLTTPAYDPSLREWFLFEQDVLPDSDNGTLVCVECGGSTRGVPGMGNGLNEVSIYREREGLSPEWHFKWIG